ncbi:MAG TPA: RNA-binding protein [candidate division Zixibacteria bacterium]|nr:RNA-binding protein [candidate division Zixibacteria bacterium]
MNIYVGNLSFDTTEDDLRDTFAAYGEVSSVNIISDKYTGRSRGFGFVEMPDQSQAQTAITELNGKDLGGRALNINEARPREERGPRSGGRGGGGHRNRY